MEKSPKELREEGARYADKQLDEATRTGSAADRDWAKAGQLAKAWAKKDGFFPFTDEDGEDKYTTEQALKAACCAREDVAAVLVLQRTILRRLDRNRSLIWACIALLGYVAYRLT